MCIIYALEIQDITKMVYFYAKTYMLVNNRRIYPMEGLLNFFH